MPQRGEGAEPRHGTNVVAVDLAGVNPLCASGGVSSTGLVLDGERRSVERVLRLDPHFRPYALAPGWPITIEVHCADGGVALVHGTVDRVPWLAGENAQRVVIVDAVAKPLPADVRGAAA